MTKAIEKKIPRLGETESVPLEDKRLYVKFFHPFSSWKWYGAEYNPKTREFFGYVVGDFPEWGYFNLDQLEEIEIGLPTFAWSDNSPVKLGIERDKYWDDKSTLKDLPNSDLLDIRSMR